VNRSAAPNFFAVGVADCLHQPFAVRIVHDCLFQDSARIRRKGFHCHLDTGGQILDDVLDGLMSCLFAGKSSAIGVHTAGLVDEETYFGTTNIDGS
jgi:hypothetical protein